MNVEKRSGKPGFFHFFGRNELQENLNARKKAFIQVWADEIKVPIMR